MNIDFRDPRKAGYNTASSTVNEPVVDNKKEQVEKKKKKRIKRSFKISLFSKKKRETKESKSAELEEDSLSLKQIEQNIEKIKPNSSKLSIASLLEKEEKIEPQNIEKSTEINKEENILDKIRKTINSEHVEDKRDSQEIMQESEKKNLNNNASLYSEKNLELLQEERASAKKSDSISLLGDNNKSTTDDAEVLKESAELLSTSTIAQAASDTSPNLDIDIKKNDIANSYSNLDDSKTTIDNSNIPTSKMRMAQFIPFEFRGSASEYFKIWIVNIALTLLTLGIYSAWAKVRTLRYIYGNTYLNNSNFEFNADPKRILIGRIIIVAFYGLFLLFSDYLAMYKIAAGIFVVFLLLLPWLIRQAISFKLKSASYRNIPFKFHAKVRSFYWLFAIGFFSVIAIPGIIALFSIINPILAGISAFVGYFLLFIVVAPIIYRKYKALVINNSSYANEFFKFTATKRETISVFVKISALTFGVSLILGGITALAVGMGNSLVESLHIATNNVYFHYLLTALGMLLYLVSVGMYKGISDGYLSNFVRDHTEIKDAKFKGEISPFRLGLISATNAIVLVFSLGLLFPWTKLRYLRYKIENTYFACSDYDQFVSAGYEKTNPLGEEALDFFDIDIGV